MVFSDNNTSHNNFKISFEPLAPNKLLLVTFKKQFGSKKKVNESKEREVYLINKLIDPEKEYTHSDSFYNSYDEVSFDVIIYYKIKLMDVYKNESDMGYSVNEDSTGWSASTTVDFIPQQGEMYLQEIRYYNTKKGSPKAPPKQRIMNTVLNYKGNLIESIDLAVFFTLSSSYLPHSIVRIRPGAANRSVSSVVAEGLQHLDVEAESVPSFRRSVVGKLQDRFASALASERDVVDHARIAHHDRRRVTSSDQIDPPRLD